MQKKNEFIWGQDVIDNIIPAASEERPSECAAQESDIAAAAVGKLLTTAEAAEFLRITPKGLRVMALAGKVKFVRLGRSHRYRLSDLQLLLKSVT